MANADAQVMSTAKNARDIDRKLTSAVKGIQDSITALQATLELMNTGETEARFQTPEIEELVGALKVAKRAALRAAMPWDGIAVDRKANDSGK